MPSIKTKKYGYGQGSVEVACLHCKRKNIYNVVSHFEERPKKIDGVLVIPLEMISYEVFDVPPPSLCDKCKLFPKCKSCDIILCGWQKHFHSHPSPEDPQYCNFCSKIKNNIF